MMNTNLLDLNNDVLNIIGDYVKKDNDSRMEEEKKQNERDGIFNFVDDRIKQLKKDCKKKKIKAHKSDLCFITVLSFGNYFFTNYGENWKNDNKLCNEFSSLHDEYLKLNKFL